MLCHSVASTRQLFKGFTRASVLEPRGAAPFLCPAGTITNLNETVMATVQLLAFVTLDGYLGRKTSFPDLWEYPDRFGLTRIRKRAVSCPEPDIPFIALTHWKEENPVCTLWRPGRRHCPLWTACSDSGWLTSWCSMYCPCSRERANTCLTEAPVLLHGGSWPGHGTLTVVSAGYAIAGLPADCCL